MPHQKRSVEWDGRFYKVRSDKIEIPDLQLLPRFDALRWLIAHTYAIGYVKPNPLDGIG